MEHRGMKIEEIGRFAFGPWDRFEVVGKRIIFSRRSFEVWLAYDTDRDRAEVASGDTADEAVNAVHEQFASTFRVYEYLCNELMQRAERAVAAAGAC